MNRINKFFISILSFVIILSSFSSNSLKAYAQYKDLNPFYIDSEVADYNRIKGEVIPQIIKTIPSGLWDLYLQEGVKVYITPSSNQLYANSTGNNYSGITYGSTINYDPSNNRVVSINGPVRIYINSNNSSVDTYFHEFGHALDFIAAYITGYCSGTTPISSSYRWQSLYSKYAAKLASFDYCASLNMGDAAEGFAESFRLYLIFPKQLQTSCPEVYSFITSQIQEYTKYVAAKLTYNNFDYVAYANEYPDLMKAFGLNKKALWEHYITYGKAEGRKKFIVRA